MRGFLLFIGWSGFIGSIVDAVIAAYAVWIVGAGGWVDPGMSVEILFRDHIHWLYWVKQFAYYVMPSDVVMWIFGMAALVLFPIRIVVSGLIGKWAFSKARRMKVA